MSYVATILRYSAIACALVCAAASIAQAQDEPDLSGRWILVSSTGPAADVAVELTVTQSHEGLMTVIAVERRMEHDSRSENYRVGMSGGVVGGIVGSNSDASESEYVTKWSGGQLIIQRGSYIGRPRYSGPWNEHGEAWELGDDRRLSITTTDRGSDAEPRMTTAIYRKQG